MKYTPMSRAAILILVLTVPLIASHPRIVAVNSAKIEKPELHRDSDLFVEPVIRHPNIADADFDGIQDRLEDLISQSISVNESGVLPVVVTQYNPVTSQDLAYFATLGGRVTHVYRYVTYGFAGVVPAINISAFAHFKGEDLSIVEYDAPLRYHLDVSVPIIRARPIVWDTHGYTGSSDQSIVILDTGLDDSHPDLGPYGDQDFSKKMVGWYDATSDNAPTPQDFGEHGTHVAGIAAGTGTANSLQGSGSMETTFSYVLPPEEPGPWVSGYVDYVDVADPGVIRLNCSWGGSNDVLLVLSNPAGNEVKRTSGTSQPLILAYDTTGKTYPTGRYEVFVGNVAGTSYVPFSCLETYPYQGLSDGYNLFTGVAPSSKLVGIKVFDNTGWGTASTIMAGMEWVIENRLAYNIVVASMSLGLEDGFVYSTLDQKADTMVKNGVVTTVSAGNDYPDYTIGSPGTAAYVLTVAATNDQNGVTSYSSNGDIAKNEFGLIKPDVAAPGGTFQPSYGNKIMSADSNEVDMGYSGFADRNLNDYQHMAGTSMSAPHVAGLAALVIQALGSWSWTQAEALKVKMILGMTSYETQSGESGNVPPLNRGDKDSKEGYGRVSADAAIEAVTMTYNIGEQADAILGSDPSDKKVWARQVSLSNDTHYMFELSVPSGSDYDLYLYSGDPDGYGQPVILQKSVNASVGAGEVIEYRPPVSGTHFIVVRWVNGEGAFSLQSVGVTEHDVAVASVSASPSVVYAGETVNVTVEVQNVGTATETLNVTAYYDGTPFETRIDVVLAAEANTTLTLTWNTTGVSSGYYVMSAGVSQVSGETNLADNMLDDGVVQVKILGDVDGDGMVNIYDAIVVAYAYGSSMGDPRYTSSADFNGDETIDILDAIVVCVNWTG